MLQKDCSGFLARYNDVSSECEFGYSSDSALFPELVGVAFISESPVSGTRLFPDFISSDFMSKLER